MPGNCRVLVEFEEHCVRLYFCNAGGRILDEEGFSFQKPDTPEDSIERAARIHGLIYDALNYNINDGSSSKHPEKPE